jgi:Na+-transporting NADH:ubiquinone oxidoreductase subunit NqrC
MRNQRVAFAVIALFVAPLISLSPATADTKSPTSANQSVSDLRAMYKIALDQFRKEFKVYEDKRREINKLFKEAIDKALTDARSTKTNNQTQSQKRQNMNTRQNAVVAATIARDAAIEALGAPPVAPTPPAKMPSPAKSKSQQIEKSPAFKK